MKLYDAIEMLSCKTVCCLKSMQTGDTTTPMTALQLYDYAKRCNVLKNKFYSISLDKEKREIVILIDWSRNGTNNQYQR
ncbi:MAG: hypothetical protein KBS62_03410 [Oscillospiraceae bacterium]|nr:hypothetical protein [Candidatus Ruminococcus equi]